MRHPATITLLAASALTLAAPTHAGTLEFTDTTTRPIADGTPAPPPIVTFQASPPPGATVESVVVELDIDHPWVGDLVITVRHAGQTALLVDQIAIDTFPFGCGGDDIHATFTDDATVTPDSLCSPTAVPTVSGDVRPVTPFAVFAGADPTGDWELVIADVGLYDTGALNSVRLEIAISSQCVADLEANGAVDSADLAVLLAAWGAAGAADLDASGTVDSSDLAILLAAWGPCPS